jgi:predicted esterase
MLHGIGDSGKGWVSIADDVDLPQAKWIFPNAKSRPLTATYGKLTSAWADMSLLSIGGPDDEQGTMETKDMIHRLIAAEVRGGIPAHRIFIGGFSQGGAMACVAALTHKQPLAGCFVLSGYVTMHKTLPFLLTDEGRRTPFFQVHARARAHTHTHRCRCFGTSPYFPLLLMLTISFTLLHFRRMGKTIELYPCCLGRQEL